MAVSDARALHQALIARGFTISRDDAILVVEPPHLLSPADIAAIRAHKGELLALLSAPADHRGDPPMYRCPVFGCGITIPWGETRACPRCIRQRSSHPAIGEAA